MPLPSFQPHNADMQALEQVYGKLSRRRRNIQATANALTQVNQRCSRVKARSLDLNAAAAKLQKLIEQGPAK